MANPITEPSRIIGRELQLDRLIGSGGFGEVYLAIRMATVPNPRHNITFPRQCVVKVMRSGRYAQEDAAQMQREMTALSSMDHPYVVPYIGAWIEASRGEFANCYCLAMRYCEGGDLHDFISRCVRARRAPPPDVTVRIMAQVFSALNYSHSRRLIHRDIKPGNVFLTLNSDGSIEKAMIGDYGLVRSLEATRQLVRTRVGTPTYISPEIAAGDAYTTKTDIFSAGTMFYELLCLHRPFWNRKLTDRELFGKVLNYDPMPRFRDYTKATYGSAIADVIAACLTKHEEPRATAYEVLVRLTSPIADFVRSNAIPVYPDRDTSPASPPPAATATATAAAAAAAAAKAADAGTVLERLGRLFLVPQGTSTEARLTRMLRHNHELHFLIGVLMACRGSNPEQLGAGLSELLWAFPDASLDPNDVMRLIMQDYHIDVGGAKPT